MTAVVGILNKRGVAIAADSAVTMNREHKKEKIANTANKMIRLSNVNPISVMITGNAQFIATPWDVVVRRYRKKRGNIVFPTVQACVDDFFSYIPTEPVFLNPELQKSFLDRLLSEYQDLVDPSPELANNDEDEEEVKPQVQIKVFRKSISDFIKFVSRVGVCQLFTDYSFEQFKTVAAEVINDHLKEITNDNFPMLGEYPSKVIEAIRKQFEQGFYLFAKACPRSHDTTLVFSGFGNEEEYPSLISTDVAGGFDGKVRYYIRKDDVIIISENNPSAICPFAQTDVMFGLLTGITPDYNRQACIRAEDSFKYFLDGFTFPKELDNSLSLELKEILESIKYDDLFKQFQEQLRRLRKDQRRQWLKALRNYSLQDMARLAENLVALTSFERHMTFSREGVGGPIDVAIITKKEGFTWLNRKSWYHHKDVGGRYGKFGV